MYVLWGIICHECSLNSSPVSVTEVQIQIRLFCLPTIVIYIVLVQQHYSMRCHLFQGIPWAWAYKNFPLDKGFSVFLKVFWHQSKLCLSHSTAQGREVFSTILPLWNGFLSYFWVWISVNDPRLKGKGKQRIWLWEWRFESLFSFYLRIIKWIPRHMSSNVRILA